MNAGAFVKITLAELIGRGCRVDTVAFDPPAVRFRTPAGDARALLVEGDTVVVEHPDRPERFHSLRSAIHAACSPPAAQTA